MELYSRESLFCCQVIFNIWHFLKTACHQGHSPFHTVLQIAISSFPSRVTCARKNQPPRLRATQRSDKMQRNGTTWYLAWHNPSKNSHCCWSQGEGKKDVFTIHGKFNFLMHIISCISLVWEKSDLSSPQKKLRIPKARLSAGSNNYWVTRDMGLEQNCSKQLLLCQFFDKRHFSWKLHWQLSVLDPYISRDHRKAMPQL